MSMRVLLGHRRIPSASSSPRSQCDSLVLSRPQLQSFSRPRRSCIPKERFAEVAEAILPIDRATRPRSAATRPSLQPAALAGSLRHRLFLLLRPLPPLSSRLSPAALTLQGETKWRPADRPARPAAPALRTRRRGPPSRWQAPSPPARAQRAVRSAPAGAPRRSALAQKRPQVPPPPVLYLSTPRTARISGLLTPPASRRSFRRRRRRPLRLKAQLARDRTISLTARYRPKRV